MEAKKSTVEIICHMISNCQDVEDLDRYVEILNNVIEHEKYKIPDFLEIIIDNIYFRNIPTEINKSAYLYIMSNADMRTFNILRNALQNLNDEDLLSQFTQLNLSYSNS